MEYKCTIGNKWLVGDASSSKTFFLIQNNTQTLSRMTNLSSGFFGVFFRILKYKIHFEVSFYFRISFSFTVSCQKSE